MIPRSWAGPVAVVEGIRRRVAECASCEETHPLFSRGLCKNCREYHRRTGTIDVFGYVKADKLADYAWLTRELGESVAVAAARIGVSVRTAWRYEAELRGPAEQIPAAPPRTEGGRAA